jgi:protein-tyrosine-phosphatase
MAETIAREISTHAILVSSCGIDVTDDKFNSSAVKVIYDKLKIDISNKSPLDIRMIDLKKIDTIYSLDRVATIHLERSKSFSGNIIELIVDDPYGLDIESYYNTYYELLSKLEGIKDAKGRL